MENNSLEQNQTEPEKLKEELLAQSLQGKNSLTPEQVESFFSDKNKIDKKWKRWAYFFSFAFPPFGLIPAVRYFFGKEDDAKEAAWWCLGLTVASVVLFLIFFQLMVASTGNSLEQIQQIKPEEIQQLLE